MKSGDGCSAANVFLITCVPFIFSPSRQETDAGSPHVTFLLSNIIKEHFWTCFIPAMSGAPLFFFVLSTLCTHRKQRSEGIHAVVKVTGSENTLSRGESREEELSGVCPHAVYLLNH